MYRFPTKQIVDHGKLIGIVNPHGLTADEIADLKSIYPEDQDYTYVYNHDWTQKQILVSFMTSECAEFRKYRRWKK